MKIVMMSNTFTPIQGGLERSIQLFSAAYRSMGHKVLIVTPAFRRAPKKEPGVIRVPALQRFNGTDFSVNLPIPGLLSKFIETFKPDVIHSHHPFLLGDVALRLSAQYRIPLVFTYHTMFEQYTHYLPLNSSATKRFVTRLSVGYANLADRVIAPSEGVRRILRQRGVAVPIDVVPTGLPVAQFAKGDGAAFRAAWKIPKEAWLAGYVGRLAPEKNPDFLCRGLCFWMRRHPRAWTLIVGEGPSREPMRAALRESGLLSRARFTGALEGQQLIDAYHAMDVFSFASVSETQGLVVLEAMAAGLPVVALKAQGIEDYVKDRRNGRLVREQDPAAWAEALGGVFALDAFARRRMGDEGRRAAARRSIARCAARAIRVYEAAAFGKRPMQTRRYRWSQLMNRVRAEWGIWANLGKATASAFQADGRPRVRRFRRLAATMGFEQGRGER